MFNIGDVVKVNTDRVRGQPWNGFIGKVIKIDDLTGRLHLQDDKPRWRCTPIAVVDPAWCTISEFPAVVRDTVADLVAPQNRLEELEAMDAQKKLGSKSSYRTWRLSEDYVELITLRTNAKNAQAKAQPEAARRDWRNDPATDKQLDLIAKFNICYEENMTKGRASQLIDAHLHDSVGSVGGWYSDGTN